jgi:Iap family predicted aminopeptidase
MKPDIILTLCKLRRIYPKYNTVKPLTKFVNKLYLLLFGILVSIATAYHTAEEDLSLVFSRINEEVLAHSKAYPTLQHATTSIGHRLTGSTNGKKAEEYTHQLLEQYGYKNVKYQPFEVEAWSRDTVLLEIVPRNSDNFREIKAVSLAHSPVQVEMKGLIIDVGNGLEADFEKAGEKVKGKVVLMNIGILLPTQNLKNLHRSEKTALAIKYGATGVIMVNGVKGGILLTGTASVTGQLIPVPALCVSLEGGNIIRQWLQEEPNLEAHIYMRNKSGMIQARNVTATLRGSKLPREKIIIGGHLDSWDLATGAIDNGIGSFTVLEIARVFKALQLKPKRTIEFVLFMGEEQGLLGSKAYINKMIADKSIRQTRYMINLDMAGNPVGFNAFGRDEMVPFLTKTGNKIRAIDTVFQNTINNTAGLHSDHQPFLLNGVPIITPVSNLDKRVYQCYHANCDNFKLINKKHMDNSVRFTAMMLYALANADEIPAKRYSDSQTKQYLINQGLKNELILGNEWRWQK